MKLKKSLFWGSLFIIIYIAILSVQKEVKEVTMPPEYCCTVQGKIVMMTDRSIEILVNESNSDILYDLLVPNEIVSSDYKKLSQNALNVGDIVLVYYSCGKLESYPLVLEKVYMVKKLS
ncbi:MAG: hypothetical protein ACLVDZ_03540 [Ruminococcus sp.]